MNKSILFTFLASITGAFASVASAAVEYRINGGAWQSIAGGVIDLGTPAQGSDIIVHIADTSPDGITGLPDEDIGLLRFRAAGAELPARVRILIASASSSLTSANINNPAFSWSPGVRTWTNGLLFEHTPAPSRNSATQSPQGSPPEQPRSLPLRPALGEKVDANAAG
ncbi:MAG: hypothetical protein Q8L55_08230 [Phycisphaerales bacterium]|nr:hypothetical protein [Phycisphaerales bacterium]